MFTRCAICIIFDNIVLIVLMMPKLRLWSVTHFTKTHLESFISTLISTIANIALILYNSSINKKVILSGLHFRHNIVHFVLFCK